MVKALFHPEQLDLAGLEEIGLAKDGRPLLEEQDLEALLAGRRTQMLELKDLFFDGFHIAALNAKLSLRATPEGATELLIHPLYKEKLAPDYLTDSEAEGLEKGELDNVYKSISDGEGDPRLVLVEFDRETNEYVVTDTDKVLAPDFVNGEELTLDQKERYRKGKEVQLADGTRFQYAGTEREGLRSNKIALIASIVIDGGLSFLLYQGLNALFNRKQDERSAKLSDGYRKAFSDMKIAEGDPEEWLKLNGRSQGRGGVTR